MQNWDSSLPPVSYEHNWYGNMFPVTHIKTEPQSHPAQSPPLANAMEHFLKQTNSINMTSATSLTPSPQRQESATDGHSFFGDSNPHITPMNLNSLHGHHPLGFNPLTPPGLPNAILPPLNFHHNHSEIQSAHNRDIRMPSPPSSSGCNNILLGQNESGEQQQRQQTGDQQTTNNSNSLTPRNTPPMDITPPKSPKHYNSGSEYMDKDVDAEVISNSSEFVESEDDESIRMPIYNSHGKMKNYKCKSCGFNAITKIAFWQHTRTHMKPEKLMQCPKCPFVTELKHHLEYHIRKHKNLKPFQCDKCNYSCVNKSMLNSHLKSHSSVYQYRCADCDYATKYCHSFKLHLRKYDHKPGLVLDDEGLPNPAIVIDVYGTRRGPKTKSVNGRVSHKFKMSNSVHNSQKTNLSSPLKGNQLPELKLRSDLQINLMNMNHQQHNQKVQQSLQAHNQTHNQQQAQKLHEEQQQHQQQEQQQQQQQTPLSPTSQMQNFLPNPLANMLQQQRNMPAFFPYWNLNLQMLAAQQQAVLAQLSPRMREAALQSLKMQQTQECNNIKAESEKLNELQQRSTNLLYNGQNKPTQIDDDDDEDVDEEDRRSESSAMDLSSQGTPTKTARTSSLNFGDNNEMAPQTVANDLTKTDVQTPIAITAMGTGSSSRRKGRVLKLETLLQNKESSISSSDDSLKNIPNDMDCTANNYKVNNANNTSKVEESSSIGNFSQNSINQAHRKSTSTPISNSNMNTNLRLSSVSPSDDLTIIEQIRNEDVRESRLTPATIPETANECGSSLSSGSSLSNRITQSLINDNQKNNNNNFSNNNNTNNSNNYKMNIKNNTNNNNNNSNNNNNNNSPLSGIFECKYCDIYFKDAVLYTIHMGYHSCDDVFKCNMCGEKCDGPVGLFVHMARNAHS